MSATQHDSPRSRRMRDFVLRGFAPRYGQLRRQFPSNPLWDRLRALGGELWLDSGDIDEIAPLWTREFTAVTTNNTLLNREIQKGTYDELIVETSVLLDEYPQLTDRQRKLEMAFVLNAYHALRLVEKFDAYVSVEEHTDLTNDMDGAVEYARRYHAICPQRFHVKIPLSPAGLLATRRVSAEGISVNHTLGFSARQNYMIARIGRPAFVNVFLGRLNSFVADNALGDGKYVGERATLASQAAIRKLKGERGIETRQIGASLREAEQVRDLAGIDVMTIPCKAAARFLRLGTPPEELSDKTAEDYRPVFNERAGIAGIGLDSLWELDEGLKACLDALENEDLDAFTPDDLVAYFEKHGCGHVLVRWTQGQIETSAKEGKIPKLANWKDPLAAKVIGLDSLMNLAGWNSFDSDQREMDRHVAEVVKASRES